MLNKVKKFKSFLVTALAVIICFGCTEIALAEEPLTLLLRIEGAQKCLFYDEVVIDGTADATALRVVQKVKEENPELNIEIEDGYYGAYISSINGEAEAQLLYDGWLFTVNGLSASVGISECEVKSGDSIVIYYSDSYGEEGFQIPILNDSEIANGILSFTSLDTTYDEQYNPIQTENPVVGATVVIGSGASAVEYTTDNNGRIVIDKDKLTVGKQSIQIYKYSDKVTAGGRLPLVLRFSPDTQIEISAEAIMQSPAPSKNEVINEEPSDNPKTGDSAHLFCPILFITAALVVVSGRKKRSF